MFPYIRPVLLLNQKRWLCFTVAVLFILTTSYIARSIQRLHAPPAPHGLATFISLATLDRFEPRPARPACVFPDLSLHSQTARAYVQSNPSPIVCSPEEDWVYTSGGKAYISAQAVGKHGHIRCYSSDIVFAEDDASVYWKAVEFENGSALTSDAFKVACKAEDGSSYANIHACIARTRTATPMPRMVKMSNKSQIPVNILMFGMDSMSRHMWQRLLPKSHKYFTEALGGHILEGYNIVGDGTPQNLLPILTGHNEMELSEVRRGKQGAIPIDDAVTFIWKRFEELGYITQWGEDMANIGTFNLRMLGFRKQPVHHYMRPYQLAAHQHFRYFKPYCMGHRPRQQVFLDWLKEGLVIDEKFFSFGFFSELSHGDNKYTKLVDNDLLSFLRFLVQSGVLNNTILIVMSDHGARFNDMRATEQGKLEERMPYFGFRFPPWFDDVYPEEMRNFKINTKRLVTPYDIHETLLDIIEHESPRLGNLSNRGISLFHEIPSNRSCEHAHIAPHWCACLAWQNVSNDTEGVGEAVNAVLQLINTMLSSETHLCHNLSLASIKSAARFSTKMEVLKFRRSVDDDGRTADMSDAMETHNTLYQVTFVVSPGGGVFESTILKHLLTGKYSINERDISRVNRYGNTPYCVKKTVPQLRPYCVCID